MSGSGEGGSTVVADPSGSVWRRWDPHVHMPGTLRSNEFGTTTLAEALDALSATTPPIVAAGVTDYCTTQGFRLAYDAWKSGSGAGIEFLFPNVELRLEVPTAKKGLALNLHLICAPSQVNELDQFLGQLTFPFGGSEYSCSKDGLVSLGRSFSGTPGMDEQAALRIGAEQFKVTFSELRKNYESSRWARENCLVAVAGGRDDGTSGLRTDDSAFDGLRQSIERLAHIIFSSSSQQRDFWIGRGAASLDELASTYGGVKACLHGSDAHEKVKLGKPDGDRFCWLKGDATYDTLRLACLAPETRVSIGSQPPNEGFSHGRIASVTVGGGSSFIGGTIPVNPGLVAIIGARGSGKTALADIIAVGAGSAEPFADPKSFVHRAGHLLNESTVSVAWTHGETTSHDFSPPDELEEPFGRGVRYLSQQFVERLCSSDGVTADLLAEIERVVFDAFPPDRRLGTTSFQELLRLRLAPAKEARRAQAVAIKEIGDDIADQHVLGNGRDRKTADRAAQQKLLEQTEVQITELVKQGSKGDATRLTEVGEALEHQRTRYQAVDLQIRSLEALRDRVASARATSFPRFQATLRDENRAARFKDEDWESFTVDFVGDVDNLVISALQSAQSAAVNIAGAASTGETILPPLDGVSVELLKTKSISELTAEQLRLQTLVGLDARRTSQLKAASQRQSAQRNRLNKLDEEIALADGSSQRIVELSATRTSHYAAVLRGTAPREATT